MRRVIASEYLTLDGVMEAPGSEDSLGDRGGWSFLYSSDEAAAFKFDEVMASNALLLGRVTYDIFAASWPARTGEFADRMNRLPKYVVSRTLETAAWENAHLIRDDVAGAVSELKRQPGQDILLYGSADLVRTLTEYRLIDEYRFMIFPLILGTGKRLFDNGINTTLKLVAVKRFSSGVVLLTYEPERKA
ncbi:MAG TPA: dihydrofolate reductase family protein [Ktedonobacterales bacterium]